MRRSQHFGYYESNTSSETVAQDNYHKQFTQLLDLKSGMKVLDAGCGQGVVACYLAKKFDVSVTGITITPYEVKSAGGRAEQMNLRAKASFLLADYANIPKAIGKFDRIYTTESLSHAVNVQKVVDNFATLLKPGGKLVCAEYEMDFQRFGGQIKKRADFVKAYAAIHGMYQFGPGQFVSYLKKAGLDNIQEFDWTEHTKPSFDRLRRLAHPMSWVAAKLRLEKYFINTMAARLYADGVEQRVFAYKVYTASKHKSQ
jgi:cyclopropane fatty-acyl-phospholipid synthase-like methyltransferase